MFIKAWKVCGREGHRQRESFHDSAKYDFSSEADGTRIIEIFNADKTGTNDYSIIKIIRDTEAMCDDEFYEQLFDGVFENSRVGKFEEVSIEEVSIID